jgi:hypothetical protein
VMGTAPGSRGQRRFFRFHSLPLARCNAFHNSILGRAPSALRATEGPQLRFLTGTGTANILRWKPRHIEIETNSPTGGQVMINQFFYPSWRAELVGNSRALEVSAAMPQGLLELQVPPGLQHIELEIPVARSEYIGLCISAVCLALNATLVWSNTRNRTQVNAFLLQRSH